MAVLGLVVEQGGVEGTPSAAGPPGSLPATPAASGQRQKGWVWPPPPAWSLSPWPPPSPASTAGRRFIQNEVPAPPSVQQKPLWRQNRFQNDCSLRDIRQRTSSIKLKYRKTARTWPDAGQGPYFSRERGPRGAQEPAFDESGPSLHCYFLVGGSEVAIQSTFWLPGRQGQQSPHP